MKVFEIENNEVELDNKRLLEIYKKAFLIRNFEKEVIKAYNHNKINTPVYLSIGQEVISATLSEFFKPDYIFAQHRCHSVYIAFGGDKIKLVDELLGKDSGCCQGKGGSPPIQDDNIGMVGHHGLIGENVPLAVGAALGAPDKKIYCVFGDGAAEEDYVFTSITFAFNNKLPILFVCEDNDLSILTKKNVRRKWELSDALKGIGMNTKNISDNPKEIYDYLKNFKHKLPIFLNIKTHRHHWHVGVGIDSSPEQDRLELIKQELITLFPKEIEFIENKFKSDIEKLWEERLLKQ
jgi:pyruvate dehydrogenase E1 component alpha subunit